VEVLYHTSFPCSVWYLLFTLLLVILHEGNLSGVLVSTCNVCML